MRRTLIATVVATAALSVNTPWAVGSAVEPSGDNVDISPREWSEGEVWSQVDPHDPGLRSYAEEFNLGLDEAYRNLSVQEEVGRRRVAMREAAGADYATTSMVHDAAGTVRLHTRTLEAAQRMVDAYVDEKGPRVRFEFVPALYSLLELSDALDEVLLRLGLLTERGDMGNGAESARAMIDPVAGEIVVSYDHDFAAERTRETGTASGPPVRYLRVQDDITAEQDSCAVSSCDMPLHGGLAVTDSSGRALSGLMLTSRETPSC